MIIILLFSATIFLYLIPKAETGLINIKKQLIRDVVYTAVSMVDHNYQLFKNGEISEEEAQERSIKAIESFRYGEKGKDDGESKEYLWINDFEPRMIMHPFVKSLNGKSLTDYKDKKDNLLFVKMAEICKKSKEGYVQYYWQYKDQKEKIVPKISFGHL